MNTNTCIALSLVFLMSCSSTHAENKATDQVQQKNPSNKHKPNCKSHSECARDMI